MTNTGTIILKGAGSVGVYAQSIGGGGGDAGFSGALNFTGGGKLKNTVGGAGKGGDGGNVTVTSTGSIDTLGAGSTPWWRSRSAAAAAAALSRSQRKTGRWTARRFSSAAA